MNYAQFLRSLQNFALHKKKSALKNMRALRDDLNYPEKRYKTVHIAGTNGKGSVAYKIAKGLELSGYRAGLYTSPHISSLLERIQINGKNILREDMLSISEDILARAKRLKIELSFFELMTLAAFQYFAYKNIDIAVVETGLGGRLDSTNIIKPKVAAITSIGHDHMYILGSTLFSIAKEKGGIIKRNTPLVLGPTACIEPILRIAKKKGAKTIKILKSGPFYDEQNSLIAEAVLRELQSSFNISGGSIKKALQFRPSCRFEQVNNLGPRSVILDVAHNREGFLALFAALKRFYPKERFRLVIGMSKDKEIKKCLSIASKEASYIHLVSTDNARLEQKERLKGILIEMGFSSCSYEDGIKATMAVAIREGKEKDEIVVCLGSFFIMSEIKKMLKRALSR